MIDIGKFQKVEEKKNYIQKTKQNTNTFSQSFTFYIF